MRKFTLITLLLAASLGSQAKDITQSQALKIAQSFLSQSVDKTGGAKKAPAKLQLAYTGSAANGKQCLYVFNGASGQGYVVVAADDQADEILGYSDNGKFDPDNMP